MALARSRLTAQGQISVPAEIRRKLGLRARVGPRMERRGREDLVRRVGKVRLGRHPQGALPEGPAASGGLSRRWTREYANTCGRSMRAADTNVLVRFAARDDLRQLAPPEAFVAGGVWASQLVLGRNRLGARKRAYRLRRRRVRHRAGDVAQSQRTESCKIADVALAALALFRKRPALGFADCLILETARKAGPSAARHLRSRARQGRRRAPALSGRATRPSRARRRRRSSRSGCTP